MTPEEQRALALRRQENRLRVLRAVYTRASGRHGVVVEAVIISEMLQLQREDAEAAIDYLVDEGLLARGVNGVMKGTALSHRGLVEVERTLLEPDRPTEHFQPAVIVNVNGGTIGAFMAGSPGAHQTVSVATTTGIDFVAVVAALLAAAAAPGVDDGDRRFIGAAADQVEQAKGDPGRLRAVLEAVKGTLERWKLVNEAVAASATLGTALGTLAGGG